MSAQPDQTPGRKTHAPRKGGPAAHTSTEEQRRRAAQTNRALPGGKNTLLEMPERQRAERTTKLGKQRTQTSTEEQRKRATQANRAFPGGKNTPPEMTERQRTERATKRSKQRTQQPDRKIYSPNRAPRTEAEHTSTQPHSNNAQAAQPAQISAQPILDFLSGEFEFRR